MMDIKRKENESRLSYIKRLTENRVEYDLDYSEWARLISEKSYSSDNARKSFYVIKPMLELLTEEDVKTSSNDMIKELEQKTLELQKERYKLADKKREINKQIKEGARRELINEEVINAINNLNNSNPLPLEDKPVIVRKGDNEGILMLSDWHYGLTVNNYWNKFDVSILENRVAEIVQQVKGHIDTFGINKMHIVLNGDFINGIIHTTLRIMSQMDVIEQVMGVADLLSKTIHEISKNTEEVIVYCSLGNHSRIVDNIKNSLNEESFERLIYRFVKERLKFHNNITCEDNKYDLSMVTFDVFNEKVFASHGDKDHCKSVVNNMNKMLDHNPTLVMLGHIHHYTSSDFGSATVISGGSLVGMDDYCLSKRIYGKVYQNMVIINKDLGKIATIDLKPSK